MTLEIDMDREKAEIVLAHLADGASLRKAAAAAGLHHSSVQQWVEVDEEFARQYASARARGYHLLGDEILEISDEQAVMVRNPCDIDGGEVEVVFDATAVARNRLRVDSRKWMLSKMLPKVYGDKIEHEHKGGVTVTLQPGDEAL